MDFKDYYSALGVARDASDDDIRKAYRKLARKYHPDVSKEADADAKMREINEALRQRVSIGEIIDELKAEWGVYKQ